MLRRRDLSRRTRATPSASSPLRMRRCTRARPRPHASPDAQRRGSHSKLGRSARGRLSSSRRAPAAAARRPAARGRVAEPARPGDRCRGARRRARARVGRGGRQAPPAAVRGRIVVRSHLRMTGRWRVEPRGKARTGTALARPPRRRGSRASSGTGRCSRSRRARFAGSARTCSPRRSTSTPLVARLRGAAGSSARRGAPGSAARRRDREHVDGRGALGDPGLAVGARRARSRDETLRDALAAARRLMQESLDDRPRRAAGSTGARGGRARAAGRSSARAGRATTTAPPTGVRAARQEAAPPGE